MPSSQRHLKGRNFRGTPSLKGQRTPALVELVNCGRLTAPESVGPWAIRLLLNDSVIECSSNSEVFTDACGTGGVP